MINLKNSEVIEIAAYFSQEVNNLSFNPQKIANEQKESNEMKVLDLYWIKILSNKDYKTDLRNEASAKTAEKLAEIPFVRKQIKSVNNEKMLQVAKKMAQEHKTLQQIFSSLVFYHFMAACNEKESMILSDTMGNSFFKLPLI